MYCNICNKHRKFKRIKISYIFKKALSLSIIYSWCGLEYEKKYLKSKNQLKC